MFTGIITKVGTIRQIDEHDQRLSMLIHADGLYADLGEGDSICVDGVCLTAVRRDGDTFKAEIMPETIRATTMSYYKPGSRVNLEISLRPSDYVGGHIVQGHVDGMGEVIGKEQLGDTLELTIRPRESALMRFMPYKGSIAISGTSLTIATSGPSSFKVALIPYTLKHTNLADLDTGSMVNIEVDLFARYIDKIISERIQEYESGPESDTGLSQH